MRTLVLFLILAVSSGCSSPPIRVTDHSKTKGRSATGPSSLKTKPVDEISGVYIELQRLEEFCSEEDWKKLKSENSDLAGPEYEGTCPYETGDLLILKNSTNGMSNEVIKNAKAPKIQNTLGPPMSSTIISTRSSFQRLAIPRAV